MDPKKVTSYPNVLSTSPKKLTRQWVIPGHQPTTI